MKLAALVVGAAVALAGVNASAQSSYGAVAPPEPGYREPTPRQWGGYWMRFSGIALIIAGGPDVFLGIMAYSFPPTQYCVGPCPMDTQQKIGIALMATGVALLGLGIPLTVVGSRRAKGLDTASALPRVVPTPHGAGLRWAF